MGNNSLNLHTVLSTSVDDDFEWSSTVTEKRKALSTFLKEISPLKGHMSHLLN